MLTIQDLSFSYKQTKVLSKIDFEVKKGEILTIAGPNGTGKSTLLKCIAGIIQPLKGSITINGKNTKEMSGMTLARHLGYVPQSSPLRFPVTVFDSVLMGRRPHMTWKPSEKDLTITAGILKSMNLEALAMREFDRLSGGQKQMVVIARAMAQEAGYLLLDEPTSSLDLKHQIEVMETITDLAGQKQPGVIMAMHDLNLAARFSDRLLMLNKGRVYSLGKPREVISEKNIRVVYEIEASIVDNAGTPFIMPVSRQAG